MGGGSLDATAGPRTPGLHFAKNLPSWQNKKRCNRCPCDSEGWGSDAAQLDVNHRTQRAR